MKNVRLLAAAVPAFMIPAISPAQTTIYSDNFNSASDASNYNIYATTATGGGATSDATFGYNYSALGIPAAPNTTDGTTLGLRLRVDNLASSSSSFAVGAIEVVTKGLTLPSQYVVSFDLWANYIGGTSLAASGSNGSTAPGAGIGTKGTGLQSPNANDGYIADTFHDGGGGANADYRVYAGNTRLNPASTPYFAAGESATAATHTSAYYSFLTSHTAPSAQTTLSASTQGGSTPAGIVGFQWTQWTITQDGTNITWAVNGHTIATVPDSSITLAGSQISLDSYDSGLSGSSVANNQLLNADIFDNLKIRDLTSTPEPGTTALLAVGIAGLAAARRLRK